MSLLSVAALISVATAAELFRGGLELAAAVGLPVTSWRDGDPTRTSYKFVAQMLANTEGTVAEYIKASFLSTAEGEWLTVLAWEVYGVEREGATFAAPTVSLTNSGGGYYELAPGELRLRNSSTGKTYRSTEAIILAGGDTLPAVALEADEEGSASSVGANEIDEFVAPALIGVVINSSSASSARDEQGDPSLREQCRSTLGALSPNGPADAYEYVARNSALTGTTEITRAKAYADSDEGVVSVYLAGPSGAVSGGAVTAATAAILRYALPLGFTPSVASASGVTVPVTFAAEGDLPAGWEELVESRLGTFVGELPIGALVARSALIAEIHRAVSQITRVTLTAPAADIELEDDEVAVIGTITGTEA